MSQERLDELVAALASARPVLDDVARARVAASITAACRAPEAARPTVDRRWQRKRWVIGAAAAAAAALAFGVALRDAGEHPAVAVAHEPGAAELPDGGVLSAVRGATAHGRVETTSLTIYGPGWATRRGQRIIVDADAVVVDRVGGDPPVEIEVRTATIRVQRATFSAYRSGALHVTVMRGDILLRCGGADATRTVAAGSSATCGSVRIAAQQPEPGALPSPSVSRGDASARAASAPLTSAPPPVADRAAALPRSPGPPAAALHRASDRTAVIDRGTPSERPASAAGATSPKPPAIIASTAPPDPLPAPVEAAPPDSPAATPEPAAPPDSPVAPSEPAAPPDLASRYAAAEQVMATNPAAARAALRALVADAPMAPEAAAALLDLARLAAAGGDDVAAHTALNQLATHPQAASLAMPAAYLRCVLERASPGYRTCLAGFRAAFPGSPRDAEALAGLAVANARAGDCRAAVPLLVEYLRRYPRGTTAPGVRAWRARCDAAGTRKTRSQASGSWRDPIPLPGIDAAARPRLRRADRSRPDCCSHSSR